jgi:Ca2+-binding EF-hand superfamily protein
LRRAIEPGADNLVIYYELTRLFEDIDIDQSNTIEWKEFLEYLSSSAWISDKYES